jgi:hypothetical protein
MHVPFINSEELRSGGEIKGMAQDVAALHFVDPVKS